jgi:hypothetical protein
MAGEDIIQMTQEELKRLHVIRKALDKSITQIEGAVDALPNLFNQTKFKTKSFR